VPVQNTPLQFDGPHGEGYLVLADGGAIPQQAGLQLLAFWKLLIKGGVLPHRSDSLTSLDLDLILFVQTLEITDLGQLFRFIGTDLVALWGLDQANSIFSKLSVATKCKFLWASIIVTLSRHAGQ
jgi:hypothetical protein